MVTSPAVSHPAGPLWTPGRFQVVGLGWMGGGIFLLVCKDLFFLIYSDGIPEYVQEYESVVLVWSVTLGSFVVQ